MGVKKLYLSIILCLLLVSMACNLSGLRGTVEVVEEVVTGLIEAEPEVSPPQTIVEEEVLLEEPTPVQDDLEPAVEEPALAEVDQEAVPNQGQIALIFDGQVYHQNLAVGEMRQLTSRVEEGVEPFLYHSNLAFSDSGRYLAYEFGHVTINNLRVFVYDLVADEEIAQIDDKMLIGWRYGEDVLLVGENSIFCDPNEQPPAHADESVDFLIYTFDLYNLALSYQSTISGGRRAPRTLASQRNLIHFSSIPCNEYPWPIARRVYSEYGEAYAVKSGWQFAFSQTGDRYVPIIYSIHGPEEDGLEVIMLDESGGHEIYREEDKYIIAANWSPDDTRILFWLGDVVLWPAEDQLMVISADGTELREVLPTPKAVIGWYDAFRLLVLPEEMDRISLYDVDSGEMETLAYLELGFDYREVTWQRIP